MKLSIGAILLGAGVGRRFGSDKRFARLGERTVAESTLELYRGSFTDLRVVVRPDDALIAVLESLDVEPVEAPDAHLGMGHSLAAGIAGCSWDFAFIGLLDMPFLKAESLATLLEAARSAPRSIIRPVDAETGKPGHPVGFPSPAFPEIANLSGDAGARRVVEAHPDQVKDVLLDDPGVVRDVDRPQDLP